MSERTQFPLYNYDKHRATPQRRPQAVTEIRRIQIELLDGALRKQFLDWWRRIEIQPEPSEG
jgi:hypothetical protein